MPHTPPARGSGDRERTLDSVVDSMRRLAVLILVFLVPTSQAAGPADGAYPSPAGIGGEPAPVPRLLDEDGFRPRPGLGYPYPAWDQRGYGPPPGGGFGYGRRYPGYRGPGGRYRQHRQYANPPLFPIPRPQGEEDQSNR